MLSASKIAALAVACGLGLSMTSPVAAEPRGYGANELPGYGQQVWRKKNWNSNREWRPNRHYGYYTSHRYYGDRYRNDWIVPGIAGAIIGGAIASAPRYVAPAPVYSGNWSAHVAWCDARYRSYRAYDNTFQPYVGPRKLCDSPYG